MSGNEEDRSEDGDQEIRIMLRRVSNPDCIVCEAIQAGDRVGECGECGVVSGGEWRDYKCGECTDYQIVSPSSSLPTSTVSPETNKKRKFEIPPMCEHCAEYEEIRQQITDPADPGLEYDAVKEMCSNLRHCQAHSQLNKILLIGECGECQEEAADPTSPMRRNPKVVKICGEGEPPVRKSAGAGGYDLTAGETVLIESQETTKIPLKLQMQLPKDHYMLIMGRSGLSIRNIDVKLGLVDEDYRGPIHVMVQNNSGKDFTVQRGDRVAQGLVQKRIDVEWENAAVATLQKTDRDDQGFGSTGK